MGLFHHYKDELEKQGEQRYRVGVYIKKRMPNMLTESECFPFLQEKNILITDLQAAQGFSWPNVIILKQDGKTVMTELISKCKCNLTILQDKEFVKIKPQSGLIDFIDTRCSYLMVFLLLLYFIICLAVIKPRFKQFDYLYILGNLYLVLAVLHLIGLSKN